MTTIPEPVDPTRSIPVIDAEDPLLEAFAYQHDLRERFRQALVEIKEVYDNSQKSEDPMDVVMIVRVMHSLATDALDPDQIMEWNRAGRPLPSLDELVGEDGNAIDKIVGELFEPTLPTEPTEPDPDAPVMWNVWEYSAEHDVWSQSYGGLLEDEARAIVEQLTPSTPNGNEYLALPETEQPES